MTNQEKELAAHLLKVAADKFAGYICNDINLEELIPDVEDRRQLVKEFYEWNGDPKEFNPESNYEYFYDFLLMDFMAAKLKKESKEN